MPQSTGRGQGTTLWGQFSHFYGSPGEWTQTVSLVQQVLLAWWVICWSGLWGSWVWNLWMTSCSNIKRLDANFHFQLLGNKMTAKTFSCHVYFNSCSKFFNESVCVCVLHGCVCIHIYGCMFTCTCLSTCAHTCAEVHGGQKRVLDALKLQVQDIVNHHVDVWILTEPPGNWGLLQE